MNLPIVAKREKSSQSGRIHFAALRDEKNRRFVALGEAAVKEIK
jgi:hypothetical protein